MRLRAPFPDDAPAVLAVMVARDMVDLGAPDYTLEDLRDEWSLSDFNLATDAVVVEAGERRIVGYAIVRSPGALAVVAPTDEGQGIGALLLPWVERRERELRHDRHRQWLAASNARARDFLLHAGYEHERSYWRMVRSLEDLADPATPPSGFELRPLDIDGDAVALHALDQASFSANADFRQETLEEFRDEHLGAHDLDARLSVVGRHGEDYAGFLLARHWRDEGVGFVDILAVHPDYQRRGLGSSLLRAAFHGFAAAGLREAALGVASDNPRALGLYEGVGMTARYRFDTYVRSISAAAR
jgi:mycothiol synthase